MKLKQLSAIERVTNQMLRDAPYHTRSNVIFKVQPLNDGFFVSAFNCPFQSHWTDANFHVVAFVGPRGGVTRYKVLSKK